MRTIRFLLPALALAATACEDPAGPGGNDVGAITLSASVTQLEIGNSAQLSATVLNTTGATMSNQSVQWSSSDVAIASVTTAGRVTAHAGGTTMIRARSGNAADSIQIRVLPARCTTAMTTGTVAPGQTRTGSLTAADCILPNDAPGDGWRFSVSTTTTLRVDLTSSQFDAFIVITDMQLNPLAFGDGNGTDAMLVTSLPAGEYVIWATTFSLSDSGAYQLQIQSVETASCTVASGTITTGQTVTGSLEHTDCLMPSGAFADLRQFTTATTTTVQIDMSSTAFDTYLHLSDADGTFIAVDDDGGGELNSRIVLTLTPGTYLIWASSYGPSTFGPYQLSVAAGSGAVAGHAPPTPQADGFGGSREKQPAVAWPVSNQ